LLSLVVAVVEMIPVEVVELAVFVLVQVLA
jgi:hypothetical protein